MKEEERILLQENRQTLRLVHDQMFRRCWKLECEKCDWYRGEEEYCLRFQILDMIHGIEYELRKIDEMYPQ